LAAGFVDARLFPELAGDLERIDAGHLPPRALVAGAVDLAVVHAAGRHGKFIAGLATERARLRKPEMMRAGGLAAVSSVRVAPYNPSRWT
jgi:hypothetical protein